MVTGFITRWAEEKKYFPASFSKAMAFIEGCAPAAIEPGRHPIDGENIYALVQRATTEAAVARPFEIHRRYIDIQVLLQGREMQGYHPLPPVDAPMKDEMAEKDVALYPHPAGAQYLTLAPMQYVIYFPGEQHSPNCAVQGPENIFKIVLKLRADSIDIQE